MHVPVQEGSTMSVIQTPDQQPTLTRVFEGLTDPQRRDVLAVVESASASLSETAVARKLAERETVDWASADDQERVRASLRHRHLPALAGLSLLEWDESTATVALGSHPLSNHPRFQALLGADDERWRATVAVHSDTDRRATASILAERDGSTTRDALARALAVGEAGRGNSEADTRDVAVRLHHTHLPKLAEAGVLEYDSDDGTVEPTDAPDVPLFERATLSE